MNAIHPKAASEIQGMASTKIKQMLCEVSLVVRLAMSQVGESFSVTGGGVGSGEHRSLSEYVASQFREFADDFEREMTAELRSRVVDQVLSELSELDGGGALDGSINGPCESEGARVNGQAQVEVAPTLNRQRCEGRAAVNLREAKSFAAVSQQRVIRFLERHDFEYVPTQTGELTYRHRPTGKKVWVPKHQRDLAPRTLRKILRGVSAILGREVRVVKGDLVVVDAVGQPGSNGQRVLKGGLD